MLIDTHAHLTSEKVINDIHELLRRARAAGVWKIVNICTDRKTLDDGLKLSQQYDWIYNTAATTPHDVEQEGETFFSEVEVVAKAGKLVGIGETGLDYFYEHSPRVLQKKYLSKYFALALEYKLPLVIHCRDAFIDLFAQADVEYKSEQAILHCFTGTLEEAKSVLDRGWYLSLSGIVTYKKSELLREVARFVPLDRLLIETDAPYLAPQSLRGKQNEPSFIVETAQVIAEEKKISFEELTKKTSENACKIFPF